MSRGKTLLFSLAALAAVSSASAAELLVAVGYGGRRIMSRDGQTWEHDQRWIDEAKDDDNVLFNIAYGLGRFIAVGGGAKTGHILSTGDGREWRELPQQKGRVATIAFGGPGAGKEPDAGRFVAGHGAELLWSTDGEHFSAGARLDWKGSVHPRRSACGDTEAGFRFVMIGDVDLSGEDKRVSWRGVTGDGTRWEHSAHHTSPAHDIAYGAGRFVAVGPGGLIESSHDGQTWQRHETAPDAGGFSRIVWTGKRFLVSGGKVAWSSPDALTWSPEPRGLPCSVAWAREGSAPAGIGLSWGGNVWNSFDLGTWKKATVPPGPSLEAVAWAPAP